MSRKGQEKKQAPPPLRPTGEAEADEKKKVTLYLPVAQARALKVYAAERDDDMSGVVSALLTQAGIGLG